MKQMTVKPKAAKGMRVAPVAYARLLKDVKARIRAAQVRATF